MFNARCRNGSAPTAALAPPPSENAASASPRVTAEERRELQRPARPPLTSVPPGPASRPGSGAGSPRAPPPALPHLGVHVGQAVAAELVEEPLALEVTDDHGDQLRLRRAAPRAGPGPRQRRLLLRGWRRGRRRRGLRLRVAGHGDGGTARPARSEAAGSPGRAPGRGWFPSGGRGGCDPGSERERREEARGDQRGSSAAAESGAIGARRALAEPRAAPAGPLRGRRGRGRRRPAAARPRSGCGGGERAGEGSRQRPPRCPRRPAAPQPRPGAAGSAGAAGNPPSLPSAAAPLRAPRRRPRRSAPRPAPSCAGRHHGGGSAARFLPQARGGATAAVGGGACGVPRTGRGHSYWAEFH